MLKYVYQVHTQGDIQIQFKEDEQAALYALKDQEEYFLCVRILVHSVEKDGKKKALIGEYFKEFQNKVTSVPYHNFVKKFLEDPDYRKQYHVDGKEWEGQLQFTSEKGVNKRCQQQIESLNKRKLEKLKFKDFANLKTFGMDSFSRMKYEKLAEIIEEPHLQTVEQSFEDEKQRLTAMRWLGRGLKVEHAVRKVKTDLEIQANMR